MGLCDHLLPLSSKTILSCLEKQKNNMYSLFLHLYSSFLTVVHLQICKEKDRHPQLWEDVHHIDG